MDEKSEGQNSRLTYDLEKMAKYNEQYLLNHHEDEIAKKMHEFTLDGFKLRMEVKKRDTQKVASSISRNIL